jgi:hypothetical protein
MRLTLRALEQPETIKKAIGSGNYVGYVAGRGSAREQTKGEGSMTAASIQSSTPIPMKRDKIIYWTSTGIISGIMLLSAYYFCFNEGAKGAFAHLGLPNYFRVELTVAKILGATALLIPAVPERIKEFAYFGMAITIASAVIAHAASGDGIAHVIDPVIVFGVLIVSYVYYHKRKPR